MGKLVVDNFNRLNGLSSTNFYRIIGRIIEYETDQAVIHIESLFDNSTCKIELDFDDKEGSDITDGLVVDVEIIPMISETPNNHILKAIDLNVINLPQPLIEEKQTLLAFSRI
jgi:hypothetical protein